MTNNKGRMPERPCPCGSNFAMAACCLPFIADLAPAPTAEALMRSRYTAFTLGNTAYLLSSWHPSTRPSTLNPAPGTRWLGLQVKRTHAGLEHDREGEVEFVARSKLNGRAHRIHETSRFVREAGRWYYVDGVTHD